MCRMKYRLGKKRLWESLLEMRWIFEKGWVWIIGNGNNKEELDVNIYKVELGVFGNWL